MPKKFYYVAGTLAALTLLASGVFAAAPYVQFLAPIAALGLGVPLIAVCAVLSAVVVGLSVVAISKNKTTSEEKTKPAAEQEQDQLHGSPEEQKLDACIVVDNYQSLRFAPKNVTTSDYAHECGNPGNEREYRMYIKCDKGTFRITCYGGLFINSVASQDGNNPSVDFKEMKKLLGLVGGTTSITITDISKDPFEVREAESHEPKDVVAGPLTGTRTEQHIGNSSPLPNNG